MTVYDLNGAKIVSASRGGGFEQTPTPNRIQFNSIQFNSSQFNSIQFNPILQFNSIQFSRILLRLRNASLSARHSKQQDFFTFSFRVFFSFARAFLPGRLDIFTFIRTALRRACGQGAVLSLCMLRPGSGRFNTPQAKCDVHRIDVNAINSEKATIAVYRILGMCDVHRI